MSKAKATPETSAWFDKVKDYYDGKLWTKEMTRNAVSKGKITEGEYEEITGEAYA